MQVQRCNISDLNLLDFRIKALFSSYGMICSPWMLLRAARNPFDNNSEAAHGRLLLKLIRTTATGDRVGRSDRWPTYYANLHILQLAAIANNNNNNKPS